MRGIFVTFEGGEGCGKTSQVELFRRFLAGKGLPHRVTREPGGTLLGEAVRRVLLEPRGEPVDPVAEALLFAACRAQLVREVIRPALEGGLVVVCDRFVDSSLAYQGYGLGVDLDFLGEINRVATQGLSPDLTFLLDMDVGAAAARAAARDGSPDRIAARDAGFHERVRAGYLRLADMQPERFCVLDASADPETTAAQVRERFLAFAGNRGAERACPSAGC